MILRILIYLLFMAMTDSFVIYDFNQSSSSEDWKIVDDGVMGGRSIGKFELNKNGKGVFYGHVSLENNGGFSSVRHQFKKVHAEDYSLFEIRVKGDGKTYQFRCKSNLEQRHSYVFKVETSKEWQTIKIPFNQMYPAFRGNTLKIPNFPGETVSEIAFLIGNKKEQEFRIELDYILLK